MACRFESIMHVWLPHDTYRPRGVQTQQALLGRIIARDFISRIHQSDSKRAVLVYDFHNAFFSSH